jgi:hypothetical protein
LDAGVVNVGTVEGGKEEEGEDEGRMWKSHLRRSAFSARGSGTVGERWSLELLLELSFELLESPAWKPGSWFSLPFFYGEGRWEPWLWVVEVVGEDVELKPEGYMKISFVS